MQLEDFVSESVISAVMLAARFIFAYIVIIWLALVYWTFRDIRRRSNDYAVILSAAMLVAVTFLPGYWLYLILRPRMTLAERAEERFRKSLFADYRATSACPSCDERLRDDFLICPNCEKPVREPCTGCARALLASWKSCPYCGLATPAKKLGKTPTPVSEELPDLATSQPAHA
jgi:cbb3-type cytochrome oxidase subunit 3